MNEIIHTANITSTLAAKKFQLFELTEFYNKQYSFQSGERQFPEISCS